MTTIDKYTGADTSRPSDQVLANTAHLGSLTPLQPSLADRLSGNHSLDASPAFMLFDLVTRLLSPYQFNPFNYNPLRQVLTEIVDFGALRSGHCPVELFLSAVLASACLPLLFQAVEIDGAHYWAAEADDYSNGTSAPTVDRSQLGRSLETAANLARTGSSNRVPSSEESGANVGGVLGRRTLMRPVSYPHRARRRAALPISATRSTRARRPEEGGAGISSPWRCSFSPSSRPCIP